MSSTTSPTMCGGWTQVWEEPVDLGQVDDTVQAGVAYGMRWQRPIADGLWALNTSSHYVAEGNGERNLERRVEYLVCDDPNEPVTTLHWADQVYTQSEVDSRLTDLAARRAAASEAKPGDDAWHQYAPDWARTFAEPTT